MKIAIIGAAGVRTPLIIQAFGKRRDTLPLRELCLMDIDERRLALVGAVTHALETSGRLDFRITRTTDLSVALDSADFVITTYRAGGIDSRVIDEHVPLSLGVLGQETTGAGGFGMALRSIPVLMDIIAAMRDRCPDAWLINFTNPAGILAEAALRVAGWRRAVGICDAPSTMQRVAAVLLQAPVSEIELDYFGLNHLGWVRAVRRGGVDYLPEFIQMMQGDSGVPGLPFAPELVAGLGMIPNEYLYYYYHNREAVANIVAAGQTRGEQLAADNARLFAELDPLQAASDWDAIERVYAAYMARRGETYMTAETAHGLHLDLSDPTLGMAIESGGYAGVALDLVEALTGDCPREMVLNVLNHGAIPAMAHEDVVEVPVLVGKGAMAPAAVGDIPDACLGLMKQVKTYERLTIEAALERSYAKAVLALTLHPLVGDHALAKAILAGYRERHGGIFAELG